MDCSPFFGFITSYVGLSGIYLIFLLVEESKVPVLRWVIVD